MSNGDDLPGCFKFGQQTSLRIRQPLIPKTPDDYPSLANDVISGVLPGSSAGGEQPKFTAFCGDRSSHVIVKFSPKTEDAIARRWSDILITEHHATEALHMYEIGAAETRLLKMMAESFWNQNGLIGSENMDAPPCYPSNPLMPSS